MLEKPSDLSDEALAAFVRGAYGLGVERVAFLPLGVDSNAAAYRADGGDGRAYFVKLRRGPFDEMSVELPRFLSGLGIAQIIPPLPAAAGRPWARLDPYTAIVYPYIDGRDGYQVDMTAEHWRELGAALRAIHTAAPPAALRSRLQRETYTAEWRERTLRFVDRPEQGAVDDPVAREVVGLLRSEGDTIRALVGRAEGLAQALLAQAPELVVCHSDLHAGNVLIDTRGALFIVDWDAPILAPKERDLMYVGGGQGFRGHTAAQEVALFYAGYGRTQLNQTALAYYRCERIVQDIAVYCRDLLLTDAGGDDRPQSLRYLRSNFLPGGTIEVAYAADWAGERGG
jgi:spectinomycin phosphotransferase